MSLVRRLRLAQLSGRPAFTEDVAALPKALAVRANGCAPRADKIIAELAVELRRCYVAPDDPLVRNAAIDALGNALMSLMSEDEREGRDFTDALILFGGIDVLCVFVRQFNDPARLMRDMVNPYLTDLVKLALRVMREAAYQCPSLGERLATVDFLCDVGRYLTVCETYQMAELLLEELLVCRRDTVDFSELGLLPDLIGRLTPGQLAWFCRLASALWMEPEDRIGDGAQLRALALLRQRHTSEMASLLGGNVTARNQSLFLSSPVFLHRLLTLFGGDSKSLLYPINHPEGLSWKGKGAPPPPPSPPPPPLSVAAMESATPAPPPSPPPAGGVLYDIADIVSRTASLALGSLGGGRSASSSGTSVSGSAPSGSGAQDSLLLPSRAMRSEDFSDFSFFNNQHQREVWVAEQCTEIAIVLCTLSQGQHKRRVQDELVNMGIIKAITERFDMLVWDPAHRPVQLPPDERPHGPDCMCNPHTSLKVQVLRLIHNLNDREASNMHNKLSFFSPEELNLMEQGRLGERIVLEFPPVDDGHHPLAGLPGGLSTAKGHGLAWRIAAVLMCDRPLAASDVDLRFWICAALESLLRGSTPALRRLVAGWGVLEVCCQGLLSEPESDPRSVVLQTTFDLLGEVLKDNVLCVEWLGGKDTLGLPAGGLPEADLKRILNLALAHLVSGNVFLRSLFLTLYRARHVDSIWLSGVALALTELQPRLLRCLWQVIDIEVASQENLCALNTAVVLLTLARLQGDLPGVLERVLAVDLADYPLESAQLVKTNESPQRHFRGLLWFWSAYYSCRKLDRDSVEWSSGLPFTALAETVALLCSDNGVPGSLLPPGEVVRVPFEGFRSPDDVLPLSPWINRETVWSQI